MLHEIASLINIIVSRRVKSGGLVFKVSSHRVILILDHWWVGGKISDLIKRHGIYRKSELLL